MKALEELSPVVGTAAACRSLGAMAQEWRIPAGAR
jgi:hypothetical protein